MTYPIGSPNVHVTGRRVVATIVDGVVLGVLGSVLASVLGTGRPTTGFGMTQLTMGDGAAVLVVAVLYYVLAEGLTGRTVGKVVTGIRVVDARTGEPPGITAALYRTLLRVVDGLLGYLVGFLIVVSSVRCRRLGDMAAGTLVVRA